MDNKGGYEDPNANEAIAKAKAKGQIAKAKGNDMSKITSEGEEEDLGHRWATIADRLVRAFELRGVNRPTCMRGHRLFTVPSADAALYECNCCSEFAAIGCEPCSFDVCRQCCRNANSSDCGSSVGSSCG